jgi:hypothetical protein
MTQPRKSACQYEQKFVGSLSVGSLISYLL